MYKEDSTMAQQESITLSVKDVKRLLNIGTAAAYNLIHSKAFPVIRIGNSFRIPKEPFFEWLKSSHMRIGKTGPGRQKKILLLRACSILSFLSFMSYGTRKAVHDRNCSRLWATSYINIENNNLSFVFL